MLKGPWFTYAIERFAHTADDAFHYVVAPQFELELMKLSDDVNLRSNFSIDGNINKMYKEFRNFYHRYHDASKPELGPLVTLADVRIDQAFVT